MEGDNRSRVTKYGYTEIRVEDLPPDHPYADWKFPWIPEARALVAQQLGRKLETSEIVHHKNGIKTDNRLENLELMDKTEHEQLHVASRPKREKESTALVRLAHEQGIDLFHDSADSTFATISVDGHRETWPIESVKFERWLREIYYRESSVAIGTDGLRDGVATLSAKASFEGPEHEVHIRIAGHEDAIYVDLCDERWRAVEVDRDGWRVVDEAPVRFVRSPDMRALPVPVHEPGSGAVDQLRELLNTDPDDFMLVLSWVVGCFNPEPPYIVLAISGEHGAGKSSLSTALRSLIDPAEPALISPPENEENLMTIATSSWVMAFDNVSFLKDKMSDALARLAYRDAFKRVKKYTHEPITFEAARPVLFNGIPDVVRQADLQDRVITVQVARITKFFADAEVRERVDDLRPRVLGTILSSVSYAMTLQSLRTTGGAPVFETLDTRMTTPVRWMVLAARRLFGDYRQQVTEDKNAAAWLEDILERNKLLATHMVLDDSPLTFAIRTISESGGFGFDDDPRKNTVGTLWDEVQRIARPQDSKSRRFPLSPRGFSDALRKLGPSLRTGLGIGVEFHSRTMHGYGVSVSASVSVDDDERDERHERPSGDTEQDPAERVRELEAEIKKLKERDEMWQRALPKDSEPFLRGRVREELLPEEPSAQERVDKAIQDERERNRRKEGVREDASSDDDSTTRS